MIIDEYIFIMCEGIDGSGKGTSEKEFLKLLKAAEYNIFNQEEYEKTTNKFAPNQPEFDITDFDAFYLTEPNYVNVGAKIRKEIIVPESTYNAEQTLEAYSKYREIHYQKLIIPIIQYAKASKPHKPIIIVQSRGAMSSEIYQGTQAENEGTNLTIEKIMKYEGNRLSIEHNPHFLILADPRTVEITQNRLKNRTKQDGTTFEKSGFQKQIITKYPLSKILEMYEAAGTTRISLDTSTTIQYTQQQINEFWKEHVLPRID